MKIEEHIFAGIEAFERKEQEHALLHACIAVDGTSQKNAKIDFSSRKAYIDFIRKYYWILEPMTGAGINFDETFWDNVPYRDLRERELRLDIASFIYYLFRCTQAHGKEIPPQYKLISREENSPLSYHIAKDRLHIPETIIFGLLGTCVFAKANKDIQTETSHYLTLGTNSFSVSDWWGLEDSFHPIAKKHNPTRVKLQNLSFSEDAIKVVAEENAPQDSASSTPR